MRLLLLIFFFFNDTATTEIYTLSLHDALPISRGEWGRCPSRRSSSVGLAVALFPAVIILLLSRRLANVCPVSRLEQDRKSTRLNSSHSQISYAVFCLKKKKIPTVHSDGYRVEI